MCLIWPAGLLALPVEAVYSFPRLPSAHSELVQGSDGAFYGTTYGGGRGGLGTVYRVTPAGTIKTLVEFNSLNGADPEAGLVQGPDGAFYGTTTAGGRYGQGTLFRMTLDGALATLIEFDYTNGAGPWGTLVLGHDGALYGTTSSGQTAGGTLFRITTNGVLSTLGGFDLPFGGNHGGYSPAGALVEGHDGAFYGTTVYGGESGYGTVFRMTTNGVLTTLGSFNSTNGILPVGGLVEGDEGAFYGTTLSGGDNGHGTVFRVTTNGVLTTLLSFDSEVTGSALGSMIQGPDGRWYGAAYYGVYALTAKGEVTMIAPFNWQTIGSSYNPGGLVLGRDGALYGTADQGGQYNYGTVFRCTLNGEIAAIAAFRHTEEGSGPTGVVLGSDGAFYGTTFFGGYENSGTIFRLTPHGQLTTLVSCERGSRVSMNAGLVEGHDGAFYGIGWDEEGDTVFRVTTNGERRTVAHLGPTNGSPYAALVQGSDGAFYGTTRNSGYDVTGVPVGSGTVFRVTTNGELKTLAFFNQTNGAYPEGALIQASDGAFYGTTVYGGIYDTGTVFRVTTNGELTSVVSFDYTHGALPHGRLVQGSDGALYGTTSEGGTNAGGGTLFRLTTNGVLTTLVSFNPFTGISAPSAGLVFGSDGALYGTTGPWASWGHAVFRVTTNGILTVLKRFDQPADLQLEGDLIFGSDGALYGAAHYSGSRGGGTVLRLSLAPRLQPPVRWSYNAKRIDFNGIPGDSYRLLRAADIGGPWELLTSLTAGPDGDGCYIDYELPKDKAFYRVVGP